MTRILLVALLANFLPSVTASEPSHKRNLLIEFGWDEPDTAFLREHGKTMAESPFDGCVFHVVARRDDGAAENLAWKTWGRRAYDERELSQARDDLRATQSSPFHQNFLRVNTTPADLDWFDDHSAILANVKLAASLAKEGHCRGVLLDTEQYQGKLFDIAKQRDAKSKTWAQYEAQARLRGAEVMTALQEGMPGLTVLLTFGPSYVFQKAKKAKIDPKETEYGLLVPFVEGMASTMAGSTRLIDGHEPSYGYREPEQFVSALARIRKGPPRLEAGFGIWLDYDWTAKGWHLDDLEKNHFSPSRFEKAVTLALKHSDEIVWIYTENPRWWTNEGGSVKLPAPYEKGLRTARASIPDRQK